MELWKVKNGSTIRAGGEVLKFHHIDGMYGLCTTRSGELAHVVAWAEVDVLDPKESTVATA